MYPEPNPVPNISTKAQYMNPFRPNFPQGLKQLSGLYNLFQKKEKLKGMLPGVDRLGPAAVARNAKVLQGLWSDMPPRSEFYQ